MKLFILSVIAALTTFTASAQTNNSPTNVNDVLIQVLSGVKSATDEVYHVSKDAIAKSVDFVSEQAPDVIKQFLSWKFSCAVIWASIWLMMALILILVSNKLKRGEKTANWDRDEAGFAWFGKWMTGILACIYLIVGIGSQVFNMVEIKVAPKVYILEYVVDAIKPHSNR